MNKLLILLIPIVLLGCTNSPEEGYRVKTVYDCPTNSEDKRAEFILQCIANANPKSDEEPEDWIRLCENMALSTFCSSKQKRINMQRDCWNCIWYEVK